MWGGIVVRMVDVGAAALDGERMSRRWPRVAEQPWLYEAELWFFASQWCQTSARRMSRLSHLSFIFLFLSILFA
jgi:hypothetical protein